MAEFYEKNEIFSATDMVRDFATILKKVGSSELSRAVVVKNGHFRAVMVSFEEYEKLKAAEALLQKIYQKTKRA
jgi:PHD/YefM family antitoxin component YafN of YafNO toxin-antitoxin module